MLYSEGLDTIRPGKYLDGYVLSLWLQNMFNEHVEKDPAQCYFVDSVTLANGTSEHTQNHFRRMYCLPAKGPCPDKRVAVAVHRGRHYFVVFLDYQRRQCHIFCRIWDANNFEANHDWMPWRGHHVWTDVATLLGWDAGNVSDVTCWETNWGQVSPSTTLQIINYLSFF